MSATSVITLYVRAGCHLCEDAETLLRRLGCEVSLVDIDGNRDLQQRYGDAVPVLERDGRILLSGKISEPRLREALRAGPGA